MKMTEHDDTRTTSPGQSRVEPDPQTDQDLEQMADHTAGEDPPPAEHRPDTMVRATGPEARVTMERDGFTFGNEPSFTKGVNAPTSDQTRLPYTVEQMDEYLNEAPEGLFPDTPGGAGATPLASDRNTFLDTALELGRFPSHGEAEKWMQAVFNALRERAYELDDPIVGEFAQVVRVGEAPEVQVKEMMWGGDFIDRYTRLVTFLRDWNKQEFYAKVASEAEETPDDPWVEAAVYSFLGTLKRQLGDDADRAVGNLGDFQEVWDRA
jgi:hypothetical protein